MGGKKEINRVKHATKKSKLISVIFLVFRLKEKSYENICNKWGVEKREPSYTVGGNAN